MEPLGDLPGGDFDSAATGISDDGSVVVGHGAPAGGIYEAFRWTEAEGMQSLGLLPGDKGNGIARDVSGNGAVIVGDRYGGGDGWRWSGAAGFQSLPGQHAGANATNEDGSIIIGYSWNDVEDNKQPTRGEDGTLEFLGLLPGVGVGASGGATHMSAGGRIIIGWSDSLPVQELFLWTRRRGILSLPEFLAALGEPGLLESRPNIGGGISADGRVIATWDSRQSRGWIITMRDWFRCLADCDGSGQIDLFDFLRLQDLFATGSPGADCDGSGALDLFDFLSFQNEFAAGCP
jgi:probable HAF family extracellular repeat protein